MSRSLTFHLAILCSLLLPAAAQTVVAKTTPHVDWGLSIHGDLLFLDAKTAADSPQLRFNAEDGYLEMSFPQAKISNQASTKAIDKGLLRKVQFLQTATSTAARAYVVSKPKSQITKTAGGYRLTIKMSEPALAPERKPDTASNQSADHDRADVKTKLPAPSSATTKPSPITTSATPSTKPSVSPATEKPQAVPTSTQANRHLITAVFKNTPLVDALAELAKKAGYTAQIDPQLSGSVSLSLSEVPFSEALAMLLEPYGQGVTSQLLGTSLTISKAVLAPPSSASPSTLEPIVYDYYPLQGKSAEKMMDALEKAVPEVSYRIDPVLNILLVAGPRQEVMKVGDFLKAMSKK